MSYTASRFQNYVCLTFRLLIGFIILLEPAHVLEYISNRLYEDFYGWERRVCESINECLKNLGTKRKSYTWESLAHNLGSLAQDQWAKQGKMYMCWEQAEML